MNTGLYHRELGFPSDIKRLDGLCLTLTLSAHAEQAQFTDRYGRFTIPKSVEVKLDQLIEIEMMFGEFVKIAIRKDYDSRHDITLVFDTNGKVHTAWLNLRKDKHQTLDISKYTLVSIRRGCDSPVWK